MDKKDFDARKNKFLSNYTTWLIMAFIIIWYTFLIYLIFGWISSNYSIYTFGFSFGLYLMYQVLSDDLRGMMIDVKQAK